MDLLADSFNRKEHRDRFFKVFEQFAQKDKEEGKFPVVFLKGGEQTARYDTDQDISFHQDSHFFFLSGLNEPDCSICLDPISKKTVLFVPNYDDGYALWCGDYPSKEDYIKKLGVDEVCWVDELDDYILKKMKATKVYVVRQVPSCAEKWGIELDSKLLYAEMTKLRLIKTDSEFPFQEKACQVTAESHRYVMSIAKPGMYEYEAAAALNYNAYKNYGGKHAAFMTIAASGSGPSTLHYVRNNRKIQDGDLLLLDGGSYIDGYCGDVTRTYPVNGKFSDRQKAIYNIVLKANEVVIENMKPGVKWDDLHILSEKIVAEGLLEQGILKGDLKEILENHVQATFYPHGLGHSLGLDTHDPPNRDGSFESIDRPGIRFLRIRCTLAPGMVMTVEPGCYFNKRMMNQARNNPKISKYFNWEKIDSEKWEEFGGVRIEDDILITEDGYKNLTTAAPKKVEDIEKLMAEKSLIETK